MTIYPKSLIARIKGALAAGLKPKQLAYWTGIPHDTIKEWSSDGTRAAVQPDSSVLNDLRFALTKDGLTR